VSGDGVPPRWPIALVFICVSDEFNAFLTLGFIHIALVLGLRLLTAIDDVHFRQPSCTPSVYFAWGAFL
jgi:hypothetical protein